MSSFETKGNVGFHPSKLDFSSQEKEIMTGAVIKMLRKMLICQMLTFSKTQMDYYPKEIQMSALNG